MKNKLKALRTLLESVQVLGMPEDADILMIMIDKWFDCNWEEVATEDEIGIVERYDDEELIAYYIILINRILVAMEFSDRVLKHLNIQELDWVLTQGVYLSDIYDANSDILEAFEEVRGIEWDNNIEELDNAWKLAIKNKFYINK